MSDSEKTPLIPRVVISIFGLLPKSTAKLNLLIPLFFTVPFFIFLFTKHPEDLTGSLIISIAFFLFIVIFSFISDAYNKYRHRTALTGRRLIHLRELGFELENMGDYYGYKGVYHKFFFRIFYNGYSMISGNKSAEICIMLYHDGFETGDENSDFFRSIELNKKYDNRSFWTPKPYSIEFRTRILEVHAVFNILTSFKKIQNMMNQALVIANEEKLNPISEKAANELMKQSPLLHGPGISTFDRGLD